MMFLTVGTQFPFDRLVRAIDVLAGKGVFCEELYAQIGDSTYKPRHFEAVASLDKHDFDHHFKDASAIIGHAGMGTITMALDNNKPLLAMPRLKRYGEVVNDHQVALAKKFEALGHIVVARDESELEAKMEQLRSFSPRPREAEPEAVAGRIRLFLEQISEVR